MQLKSDKFKDFQNISSSDVMELMDSHHFADRIFEVLGPVKEKSNDIYHELEKYLIERIFDIRRLFEVVDDQKKVQYYLSICYTRLKSDWILHNSHLQFQSLAGNDEIELYMYRAALIAAIIDVIEPLIEPTKITQITNILSIQMLHEL